MSDPKASWRDNDSVAALSQLSSTLDQIAEVAGRVAPTSEGREAEAPLPLQNLPAHLIFARHWEAQKAALLSRVITRPCPLCGGDDRWTWFPTQDGYRYDVCRACGMVHIPDVLPLPVWDEYFRTLPEARRCLQEQMTRSIAESTWENDRIRFGRYLGLINAHGAGASGARLLDLGSFTGTWLRVASDQGLAAHGIEGLEEAVTFARAHFPQLRLEHRRTEQLEPGIFGGKFDVVTMWEVLEHTFDPVASLRLAAATLKPGGLIALSVPNARNVQFSTLGQFCFYAYGGYHGTGHINMFSPVTLERVLDIAGFDTLHLSTEFGTDWRQLLHFLRQDFDRIHCYANLVRRGDTPDHPSPELSVLLNWLSPALTRLENACLAGPITIAIARKRS